MIIVAAHVQVQPGKQKDFVQQAQPCIAETRKEQGNISYTLLANTEDDCKFTFFEEWETQASLDAHMKTAHFEQFGAALPSILAAPLEINIYETKN